MQLAGGGEGLKLSTDSFTLKRGDKTVVTVRREPRAPAPPPKPASDLLAGAGTEEVGEIARFQSPHDLTGAAFLLPDGRRVLYSTGGDYENDQWVAGKDPALWLGDLADPKNPRKFTGHAPGGISLALSRDGRLALTASADKTLRLWDVETGKSRRVRREETGLGPVAFSPDERHAAYVCGDTIRLCDLKTGDELMTFRGHTGGILDICLLRGRPPARVRRGRRPHDPRLERGDGRGNPADEARGRRDERRRLPGRSPGPDGQLGPDDRRLGPGDGPAAPPDRR